MDDVEYAFIHIPKNGGMSIRNAIIDTTKIKYCGHGVVFRNIQHLKQIIVLREPIDRFTSAFFYLKQYKKNKSRDLFKSPEDLIQGIIDFDINAFNFMKIHDGYHHVNGIKINTDWVFHKQVGWIDNPYKILLYEHLEEDFSNLCGEIGCEISLPHVNRSSKIDFDYSPQSLDFLNIVYKEDVDIYNSTLNNR
jgi:hypothetical protein